MREFPVLHIEQEVPEFNLASWRLSVDGLVEQALALSFPQVTALPAVKRKNDIYCVTGWVVEGAEWEGVLVGTLLEMARPKPEAGFIVFHSQGVYNDCLSIQEATDPEVLLAYRLDGQPLPSVHGGPLRLVVPGQYYYKSVKWLRRLELVAEGRLGYWEERGYPAKATIDRSRTYRRACKR